MRNQGSINKRATGGFVGRGQRTSGALRAGSLGDIVGGKTGGFTLKQNGRHQHSWISGHEVQVCTKCGFTRPKAG